MLEQWDAYARRAAVGDPRSDACMTAMYCALRVRSSSSSRVAKFVLPACLPHVPPRGILAVSAAAACCTLSSYLVNLV